MSRDIQVVKIVAYTWLIVIIVYNCSDDVIPWRST